MLREADTTYPPGHVHREGLDDDMVYRMPEGLEVMPYIIKFGLWQLSIILWVYVSGRLFGLLR